MQIYGDTCHELGIAAFANELLARAQDGPDGEKPSTLRALLIACGQLEQLVLDTNAVPEELRESACRATDHAAAAFYSIWARGSSLAPHVDWEVAREIRNLRAHLGRLALAGRATAKLKIPEGFAFYALYPEQYCAAAVAYWKRHGRRAGVTHVIGLRSIGTTLSAIVAVVLKAANVVHRRYTVRPEGHPFHRQIRLPNPFSAEDVALVVDEGPGLSGSSFFAAARALNAASVASTRQAYFCAHPEPPGAMASEEGRAFWEHAERHVASSHDPVLSPAGSLCDTIRAEVSREFESEVELLDDLSRGQWRRAAFGDRAAWPASHALFERPKLLARLADGRRVLLKYYGQVLRPDPVSRQLLWSDEEAARQIAKSGASVAQIHGYVARCWIQGELLTPADKGPALLAQLAEFLAKRSWQQMNADGNAANALYFASNAVAPREWLRSATGRIVKLPETIAGYDHTAIEAEPLGWDLAAAVVEWRLTPGEARQLLALFRKHSGIRVAARDLSPHVRRYARFQREKALLCLNRADSSEARRLETEASHYAVYER